MVSKFDEFKASKEYKLWGNIKEVCDLLNLRTENDILNIEDLNEYWEPLLDRLFKLGICFKQTGKLKELHVDWIRPCFYIKTELEFVMDGKKYEPEKESLQQAQKICREFRYLIGFIQENYDRLDPTNFKNLKTDFQKKSSEFFKAVIPYALKNGYRYLKANVKEILRPLLDLRKANFNLFMIELSESGDMETTLFQDRKEMKEFMKRIGEFFVNEEFKMKRDCDMEKLEEFMNKNQSQVFFEYAHQGKKKEEGNYIVTANRFRKESLQLKFEEGFDKMLKYLYDKKKEEFYLFIDVHKLFTNIKILGNNPLQCVKFYLDQEKTFLSEMKIKLYEMKINGLTRCKMPITKNEDLISIIKKLYDSHNVIENLMGNKLRYDQFVFFYNSIKFVMESSLKDELTTLKSKAFMESCIPNYIILCAIRQASIILEKMRVKSYCKNGQKFVWSDYYQIEKMPLDPEEDETVNAFEMNETMKKFFQNNPEVKERVDLSDAEINEYGGRFWILEGFFPIEDRPVWLEAIELLRNINTLVIDDIRDFLLMNNEDHIKAGGKGFPSEKELGYSKKDSRMGLARMKTNVGANSSSSRLVSIKNQTTTKKIQSKQISNNAEMSFDSEDELGFTNKQKIQPKLENLRPPFVWNFPIEQISKAKKKKQEETEKKVEIRNINPTDIYTDGRVKTFLNLLQTIKEKLLNHSKTKKGDNWKFFLEKILAIWNITYLTEKKIESNIVEQDAIGGGNMGQEEY